jgi:predicted enzyme related to lactoylglutathione lyase
VREAKSRSIAPVGRLGWIQTDCYDPVRLAEFWRAVLGVEIEDRLGQPPHYVNLKPATRDAPRVCFQRVPEAKAGKNRLHFDVGVDDVDAATRRVEALGGSRVLHDDYHEYGYRWRLMSDPEGNEFCLIYQ